MLVSNMYCLYTGWCKSSGYTPKKRTAFGVGMELKGHVKKRTSKGFVYKDVEEKQFDYDSGSFDNLLGKQ